MSSATQQWEGSGKFVLFFKSTRFDSEMSFSFLRFPFLKKQLDEEEVISKLLAIAIEIHREVLLIVQTMNSILQT